MADIENTATNTAGEAGENTNFDMNSFIENIANAVSKRTSKIENSIVNDNIASLSKEDQAEALKLWNDHKEKEANKTTNLINTLTKERDELKAKVSSYETKEKQANIKANSIDVFKEMNITDDNKIKLITDLAGDRLYTCTAENGEFDGTKAKALFEDITKKYNLNDKEDPNPSVSQISAKKQEKQFTEDGLDKYRKILGIKK